MNMSIAMRSNENCILGSFKNLKFCTSWTVGLFPPFPTWKSRQKPGVILTKHFQMINLNDDECEVNLVIGTMIQGEISILPPYLSSITKEWTKKYCEKARKLFYRLMKAGNFVLWLTIWKMANFLQNNLWLLNFKITP